MFEKIQKALPAALRPYAKAVTPAAFVVVGVLARAAITGTWDRAQWGAAIAGLLAATITYFVPNATPYEVLVHPGTAALDWLNGRPVPDVLQLTSDEHEKDIVRKLATSAEIADRIGTIKPLEVNPPGHPVEASHTTVSGRSSLARADDRHYLAVAASRGCRRGLARVIIMCARRRGIPISLGFALIHHESGWRKVFGHDPTIFVGAGLVTKAKYLAYRAKRRASGNRLMQGVGEGQLTWWATQDAADRRGGCWTAEANVDTAFITLGANIHRYGYAAGIERYNGFGPKAHAYSVAVRAEAARWHEELTR